MLRNNPKNPYSGLAYKVVGCWYCGVTAGKLCVVKSTNRITQGLEDHEARAIAKRAAYDAWEKGRLAGRAEITAAMELAVELIKKADEPKTDLKEVS